MYFDVHTVLQDIEASYNNLNFNGRKIFIWMEDAKFCCNGSPIIYYRIQTMVVFTGTAESSTDRICFSKVVVLRISRDKGKIQRYNSSLLEEVSF